MKQCPEPSDPAGGNCGETSSSILRIVSALVLLFAAATCCAARDIEFNRDVRPILSDKCYLCHGADAKAKNIPLRMDSEPAAKGALPKGEHAVVEGHPERSEMIRRITAQKAALRMPPAYSGLKLTETE